MRLFFLQIMEGSVAKGISSGPKLLTIEDVKSSFLLYVSHLFLWENECYLRNTCSTMLYFYPQHAHISPSVVAHGPMLGRQRRDQWNNGGQDAEISLGSSGQIWARDMMDRTRPPAARTPSLAAPLSSRPSSLFTAFRYLGVILW